METLKAFGYLRVSGMAQIDGDGFTRQLETIQDYAQTHSIDITEVFREEGVSGATELDGRVALPALMVALEQNGVKTVLIEKLDRLARDLLVQESILGDMRRRGFTLISALEPDLCSQDPSRVLMRQIFGAIAQYDKTMIVLKTRAARDRMRAKTGKCEGPKFYGDLPGEQEQLTLMRSLREEGLTLDQVRAAITMQGLTARSGKPWTIGALHRILSR